MLAALLLLGTHCNDAYCKGRAQPDLKKLFHLVGIPGLERDERVNLTMSPQGLSFDVNGAPYLVPYASIHHVLLFNSDRRYEGTTSLAAMATYGVGALLILKKHHVDTVVLDYVNERGGKMGIVLQMEISQGEIFRGLLKSRNLSVEEPEGVPTTPATPAAGTGTQDRSKP